MNGWSQNSQKNPAQNSTTPKVISIMHLLRHGVPKIAVFFDGHDDRPLDFGAPMGTPFLDKPKKGVNRNPA